jgi:serine phosphatase RsbU (regulator of sigma subunit)
MKFINKYSENTLRILFVFIALFFMGLNLFSFYNNMFSERMTTDDCLWILPKDSTLVGKALVITQIIPGGVADKAGLKENDLLLAINGMDFKNTVEAMAIINKFSNEVITYTISRNGLTFDIPIRVYKFFNVQYTIFWMLGFGFLFVGLMVGYSKPKELTSQLFFFMGCSASIGFLVLSGGSPTGLEYHLSDSTLYKIFFRSINIFFLLCLLIYEGLFIHFFLYYPRKYELKRRKLKMFLIYGLTFVFPLLQIFYFNSKHFPSININSIFFGLPFAIYLWLGIHLYNSSYKKIRDAGLKKSLGIIQKGFIIAFAGGLYIFIFQFFANRPIFLINPLFLVPAVAVLAIPFSFGFSIFKYRILDTEFVVKKGLVFGIVTIIIIGFYLLLVYIMDRFLSDYLQEDKKFFTIAFIVIVTFTFDFVNGKAKDLVDKQFYRERYNYRKSLLGFSQELSYLNNINELLEKISESVRKTMGVKEFYIWMKDDKLKNLLERIPRCENYICNSQKLDEAFNKLFRYNKESFQISEAKLSDSNITQDEKTAIRESKIYLAIPVYLKERLIGALNFGRKSSGKAYSDEDIDLLKTFALQSAISFENSRLQNEEVTKKKIDEELRIAKNIQIGLLPKENFEIKGLEISGYSEPAKSIGGDFYDIIKLDEKKLLVVVADVSGKGIPAALYMSKVQAMIQFASQLFRSPKEILIEVNKQIYDQIEKKSFITMVIALFDLERRKVTIARAGQNPVLYMNKGQIEIIQSKGLGLGLCDEKIFDPFLEEIEIDLVTDNLFLFYSDGLTESMNKHKDEYGLGNVINIMMENKNNRTKQIETQLLESVSRFKGSAEQNDDITFVVVKVKE